MSTFTSNKTGGSQGEAEDIFRVMIVDDSAVIRGAIAQAMEGHPNLFVSSSVSNGEMAVRALQREPVDVIVLDIEMPVMDGLTALPQLKAIDPAVQVIMASTLTQKNAEISLKAMSLGATDYIPKPTSSREVMGVSDFRRDLVEKVLALGALARRSGVRVKPLASGVVKTTTTGASPASAVRTTDQLAIRRPVPIPQNKEIILRKEALARPDIVAIGSSTGGPQALFRVIKDMGSGLPQPIVITQHMPPSFTAILAEHITRQCQVTCVEANDGDVLKPGQYYVAPGDYHMLIEGKPEAPTVRLVKDPPENFCRPSVDPMLRSLIPVYGRRILVVILTGMGQDGTRGGEFVVKAGGAVLAQDEATSVVWGMPGAAAMAGICSSILPLNDIGGFVRQTATRPRS